MNQIVRSPGLYYEKEKNTNNILGTLIPNQGSWLTIKINS